MDLLISNIFFNFSLSLTLSERGRQLEGKRLCFVIIKYMFLYSFYIYQYEILNNINWLPSRAGLLIINQRQSLGIVLVSKDEPRQDAVVDGLDGLLLLVPAVAIHAIVCLKDLQDLPLLFFACRLDQQFCQFLKLLIVDLQQMLLLAQGLRQHRLLLRFLETQSVNAVFLKRVDLQFVFYLLSALHQLRIRVGLEADIIVEGICCTSLLEGPVELFGHFILHKFLRSHHVPPDQYEFFIVVHVVLPLPQPQVFVFDHIANEFVDWSGANPQRRGESELIREFLLQGVEQSEGDADVAGDVLGVVGGHTDKTHGVDEYFLHLRYLKIIKSRRALLISDYYIITQLNHQPPMIIRRIASIIKASKYSYFSQKPKTHAENMNYDHFFRGMQKSTKPIVAINLFEKYENQVNGSNRYMGITLRNLTRLLKKHEGEDLIIVNKFIERRLHKFKLINLKQLSEKEMDEFLLFSLNLTSINHGHVSEDFNQWIQSLLDAYLERLEQAGKKEKLHNIQIISSLIKPISNYFPHMIEPYVVEMFKISMEYTSQLVIDGPTFISFLMAVNELPSAQNHRIRVFAEELSEVILKQNLVPTFEYNALADILKMLYKVKLQEKYQSNASLKIENLIETIQEYFLSSILTLNGKDIQDSLPIFMEYNPQSKFIQVYATIIALSINSQGEACLDPVFIVQSLSYLSSGQMNQIKELKPQWQYYFIKFLDRYFKPGSNFKRSMSQWMEKIVSKELISLRFKNELMSYCTGKHRNAKQQLKPLEYSILEEIN